MTIDFKKICELKKELSSYLEEKPHLKDFQKEIEDSLSKIGSNKLNRMNLLSIMMKEKIAEQGKAFEDLRTALMSLEENNNPEKSEKPSLKLVK